ncbi:MAG: hypothetical protein ACRDJH_02900 [Thermomicrobiales bacterium]
MRYRMTLLVIALLTLGTPTSFAPGARAQDELFDLPILAVNCERVPTVEGGQESIHAAFTPTGVAECDPGIGAAFTVTDAETADVYGSCIAEAGNGTDPVTANCTVQVPYGTTVVVTEDVATIPAGYEPLENPKTVPTPPEPIVGGIPPSAGFLNLRQEQPVPEEEPAVAPTTTAEPLVGRPAHVHAGTCHDLDPAPRFELTAVAPAEGEPEGSAEAIPAEASYTALDVPLDDLLLAEAHAITIHESDEALRDGEKESVVACGEVGGARRSDGAIAIGLREQNDSGFVGIAYLAPDSEDADGTQISVFVAEDLAEEE